MAKVRRNDPCPCGSGRKAKRCCASIHPGPGTGTIPAVMCALVMSDLHGMTEAGFSVLFDRLALLPHREASLRVPLSPLSRAHLDRAITALRHRDGDTSNEALVRAVCAVDTARARRTLAFSVVDLRQEDRIGSRLAALAVLDLNGATSSFFVAAVLASVVALAAERRPDCGALVVAAV